MLFKVLLMFFRLMTLIATVMTAFLVVSGIGLLWYFWNLPLEPAQSRQTSQSYQPTSTDIQSSLPIPVNSDKTLSGSVEEVDTSIEQSSVTRSIQDTSVSPEGEQPSLVTTTASRRAAADQLSEETHYESVENSDWGGVEVLAGRVVGLDGQGLAGVVVSLSPMNVEEFEKVRIGSMRMATIDAGRFAFENLPAGDYTVSASEQYPYSGTSIVARSGNENLELALAVEQQIKVGGQITSPDLEPLAGVVVSINEDHHATSDQNGRYLLQFRRKKDRVRIRFRHQGYREYNEIIDLASSEITFDKTLEPDADLSLTGTVVDGEGEALEKAVVWLSSRSVNVERRIQTDGSGKFVLTGLAVADDYQLTAQLSGHRKFSQSNFAVSESNGPLHIVLDVVGRGDLSAVVVDAIGNSVPGYSLRISSAQVSGGTQNVVSDQSGRIETIDLYQGPVHITSKSQPVTQISGATIQADIVSDLVLVVDHGDGEMIGQIADELGYAIAGATVSLHWRHSSGSLVSTSQRSTESDADGNFGFSAIGAGARTLTVTAPGFDQEQVRLPDEEVLLYQTVQLSRSNS